MCSVSHLASNEVSLKCKKLSDGTVVLVLGYGFKSRIKRHLLTVGSFWRDFLYALIFCAPFSCDSMPSQLKKIVLLMVLCFKWSMKKHYVAKILQKKLRDIVVRK